MHLALLTFTLALPGCRSLKEKRQRVGGLHQRLGHNPALAVCESGSRDNPRESQWSVAVVATSRRQLDRLCQETEQKLAEGLDGQILDLTRELL